MCFKLEEHASNGKGSFTGIVKGLDQNEQNKCFHKLFIHIVNHQKI